MPTITISAANAAAMLPAGRTVHTFIRCGAWMGADVDRDKILAAFEAAGEVEITPEARAFKHQMSVELSGMRTYIDTDQRLLRQYVPQAFV